jgi:hypothetical protein
MMKSRTVRNPLGLPANLLEHQLHSPAPSEVQDFRHGLLSQPAREGSRNAGLTVIYGTGFTYDWIYAIDRNLRSTACIIPHSRFVFHVLVFRPELKPQIE